MSLKSMKNLIPLILLIVYSILAQQGKSSAKQTATQGNISSRSESEELISEVSNTITINNQKIAYTAKAGRLPIGDSTGNPDAFIFYIAYQKQPLNEIQRRPITFAFNGGPGGSSIWLHLGAAGPMRVPLGTQGTTLPDIDTLTINQYTWLPFTDLVFVDPVGTGFSTPNAKTNTAKFYTVEGDVIAAAQFITTFLTKFNRWKSPLYLAGESYGTTRVCGLCDFLQNKKAVAPEGIILLSLALNFQTFSFDPGNDLPCVLILPSYCATAWYHKRLNKNLNQTNLQKVLSTAEFWSEGSFHSSLFYGSKLAPDRVNFTIDSLTLFTGLRQTFIKKNSLRIDQLSFAQELIEDSILGILDSRITSAGISTISPFSFSDPSLFVTSVPYTALINDYLRNDLKYITKQEYVFLSDQVNRQWKWSSPSSQGYLNVTPMLCKAMSLNKCFRVFAGMGYYDLTTPYCSQKYTLHHLSQDSSLLKRCTIREYPTGHMIYTSDSGLSSLTGDLRKFYFGE
jgi:carboxypeptidase C (cathepsin A)